MELLIIVFVSIVAIVLAIGYSIRVLMKLESSRVMADRALDGLRELRNRVAALESLNGKIDPLLWQDVKKLVSDSFQEEILKFQPMIPVDFKKNANRDVSALKVGPKQTRKRKSSRNPAGKAPGKIAPPKFRGKILSIVNHYGSWAKAAKKTGYSSNHLKHVAEGKSRCSKKMIALISNHYESLRIKE